MFDTVVIATDGSTSVERAVSAALDVADRFDAAAVHALYVEDTERDDELEGEASGGDADASTALDAVAARTDQTVETAVREGNPVAEIVDYATEVDADLVATGTRGRHGAHSFLLGSVAEGVVRQCPIPVLTVRQLEE